ncbi:MAG: sugar ABC transporter permease [Anaerolineae bacterium]|nr:sugar ABC transporter permease [Chloroflexota bacterium]MBP6298361.1 sugar ABC transporter permease [Anaerolineae bacterium]
MSTSAHTASTAPPEPFQQRLWRLFSNNESVLGYLLILPSVIGFTIFLAVPAVRAFIISFYEWNLLSPATYTGFGNYNTIFSDDRFWDSLRITVSYVLWNIPLQTTLAILIAVLLERFSVGVSSLLRGLVILPWLMPNVVVALLWLWILDPSIGIMNVILKILGVASQPFLGSPDQVIPSIALINIWRHVGYTSILIYAGLKTIPKSLYEAASIDGAGWVAQFVRITLPLLRPVLVFVLVTTVIGSFQVFDTIAVTTAGGPAGSSRTIIFYIYDQVFNRRINMGTATAASVFLFTVLVTITIIQMRYLRSNQSDLADYS